MTEKEKLQLQIEACDLRRNALIAIHACNSGHPGGSLSAADLLTYLYFKGMKIDPQNPKWEDRDRLVLSKGHAAPGLYSALALRGFFPVEELTTLRKIGSRLQGHPNMNTVPGVDMSTGSLGQGISAAAGMAKAAKYLNKDLTVYTLMGDGELAEGECWEAFMFASNYKLDNLCVFVDVNRLQIDGRTSDVMNTEPLDKKLEAFGFRILKINGHDMAEIEKADEFYKAGKGQGVPTAILMDTLKGKGVSFMEDQAGWHGKAPSDEELEKALAELDAAKAELEAKCNG